MSTKFDCPVARQNISFVATAHDCETVFLTPSYVYFNIGGIGHRSYHNVKEDDKEDKEDTIFAHQTKFQCCLDRLKCFYILFYFIVADELR